MNAPDPWATNEWQRTLVTPLLVGGPGGGKRLEPRPRYELPLQIQVPVPPNIRVASVKGGIETPRFGKVIYHLGPYVDAFTVEYR